MKDLDQEGIWAAGAAGAPTGRPRRSAGRVRLVASRRREAGSRRRSGLGQDGDQAVYLRECRRENSLGVGAPMGFRQALASADR
jgi:hypothetical protein